MLETVGLGAPMSRLSEMGAINRFSE